ncbi:endonuclease III [Candidatus Gracilibacteria bacterium]|nr:endonuclease III [Candidatus Gracilibacteria bacterium]
MRKVAITKDNIKKIVDYLDSLFPDAKTELVSENEFQFLIAIIMSAQTTDKQVNKANQEFFKVLKSPEDGLNLGQKKIENYIKSIGFYKSKAKNIYKTCEILSKEKLSDFDSVEKLQKLYGVGIKTAKVFLSVTKNTQVLAVDTHVHRVLNRLGFVKTKTPLQTDKEIQKVMIGDDLARLHHTLILFGRYHCTARNPKCNICKLNKICRYYKIEKLK